MSLIVVDPQKCTRDGLCVTVCPSLLLELKDGAPTPSAVDGAEEVCNNCGHCVAICPHGALSQRAMAADSCPPRQTALLPSGDAVVEMLRARRSVRAFRDEPVPAAVLEELLDVVHYAPTGSNRQQVRWLVVHDPAEVRRLAGLTADWLRQAPDGQSGGLNARYQRTLATATARGMDYICRGAPHLIFAHGPRGRDTDGVIALTYLELAAFARGLGVCWAGFVTSASREWEPMQAALALPPDETVYGALMVGYSKYRYQRHPLRNPLRATWR